MLSILQCYQCYQRYQRRDRPLYESQSQWSDAEQFIVCSEQWWPAPTDCGGQICRGTVKVEQMYSVAAGGNE